MKIRDRIKSLRRVKASDLLPHPANWRTHPEAQQDALRGLLAEVGFAGAALVRETPDGLQLIDGHLRGELAGDAKIPVLVLDVTEEEAAKILATFDPVGKMAEADQQKLGELLTQIDTENEAVQAMLDGLAEEHGIDLCEPGAEDLQDPEPQIDRAAELQKEWGTAVGQLWTIEGKAGEHRILCGDSTKREDVERVCDGSPADMMFADPPYGVDYDGGHFHSGDVNTKRARPKLAADSSTDIYGNFLPVVSAFVRGPCYMWFAGTRGGAVYAAVGSSGFEIHALIIWHKINATYAAMNAQYKHRHEPCLYFKPKGSTLRWSGPSDECTLWEIKRDAVNDKHPTQKPVELAARAIGNHDAPTVLDPFLGSGTTLVACEQLSRRGVGIEISPAYVAVICQRMKDLGLDPQLAKS